MYRVISRSSSIRCATESRIDLPDEDEICVRAPRERSNVAKGASNDGAVIQVSRGGCATGLVTLPNRYMHSPVELVAESDLQQAADLIVAFCMAVKQQTPFIPGYDF